MGLWYPVATGPQLSSPPSQSFVYFSPDGDIASKVIKRIDQADHSIRVLGYSFTSRPIASALVRAQVRGVDVRVVLDKSQETAAGNQCAALRKGGVAYKFDEMHAIMHEKVIIIDGRHVLAGSYNWSGSAETRNAENLRVTLEDPLVEEYLDDWKRHDDHALDVKSN